MTLVLAVSGSFVYLAVVSAIARLLVYSGTCAAVLALRRQSRAPFTIPFGAAIPVIALLVCLGLLTQATLEQLRGGGLALLAGAVLYLIARSRT